MATPQRTNQAAANVEPKALPIAKFARTYGIGQATVYRHLKNGLLQYKVVGTRRLVLVPPTQEGPFQKLKPGPRKRARTA
jgi:hypothetical protein